MRYKFSVIGLGKVGSAMLALLAQAGHCPVWAVSSGGERGDVTVYPDVPPEPCGAEVVLLAVPDSVIAHVAGRIAEKWKESCEGLVFCHFSGLHASDLLEPLAWYGGETGSLHPLQAIADASQTGNAIREAFFTFEGSPRAGEAASDLVASLGSHMLTIAPEDKVLYHAAAVIASNYLVAIASQASELLKGMGLGMEQLIPLIQSTVNNLKACGEAALTGPIQRGDWNTVEAHISSLRENYPDLLPSYLALGRYTARLATGAWPDALGSGEKVLDLRTLRKRLAAARARGMRVVFTNGCFDILHEGHVSYLREAKALGDILVVGLNSDTSVRRLKGPERPVNGEASRAAVLSGLEVVDYVCVFEEDTPYELIRELRPDVLVKGGDWDTDRIVGADIVASYGGEVRSLAFREGHSTTGIINRIRSEESS
ncbi:MAG TPA: D-glycero-beta-D-manno-heptose 1-phosphate adenylyltransferase [Deltaproteobacteria bacterium]|nr:D-glycero-beta-D-manno-heptose 1-phosphate adenylyltransferase [Deltaproteobacteria bacterium]